MTTREIPDWLTEFYNNATWGEAPPYFYFWVGVATIAATLRRRVWLPMGTFNWYPNLYTLLVAPPGVVAKTTTADLGFGHLLPRIPNLNKGPTTLTWQALYDAFSEVGEEFPISPNETSTQYALYINSGEFGTTLNPRDTEMIDHLVTIWDGKELFKRTRKDGQLIIPTPCLNLIACTTPDWISENVPTYLIGGGLTSRMIFVYGDKKAHYRAYPYKHMPGDYQQRKDRLIRDLERISNLVGAFSLTPAAEQWGEQWYEYFHEHEAPKIDRTLLGGYIARKQTLVHKVAMCLVVSYKDDLIIDLPDLERAVKLITELEENMPLVYSKIGMSKEASAGQQVMAFLDRYGGKADFNLLYRYMHKLFPDVEAFEKVLMGLIEAKYITIDRAKRLVIKMKDSPRV